MAATLVFAPAVLAQQCPAGTQPFSPSGSGGDAECVSNEWLGSYFRATGEVMPEAASASSTSNSSTTSTATASASASSTATASAASAAGGSLPDTGGFTSPFMGIGALMVLAGAGMVSVAIVRRAS
jgi:hypothetical protein